MFIRSLILLSLLSLAITADKKPCQVCRDLTKTFQEHFDRTVGHNFGGGNTAWEEKSLGQYATSETRLVEIIEKTSRKCDYKCASLLEDQEEYLEEWFFKRQEKTRVFDELCVEHLKRCCPENTWGPDCAECPGGTEAPCGGHGKCHGEGDREKDGKLSGTCTCDKGYNGTLCEDCKAKFVRVDDTCEECSKLCKSGCTAPGPKGCMECKKGYEMHEETGCVDIDECSRDGCGDPLEDCLNSPGTYECICKTGYHKVQGQCQLEELYADENEPDDEEETTEGTESPEDLSGDGVDWGKMEEIAAKTENFGEIKGTEQSAEDIEKDTKSKVESPKDEL